MIWIRTLLFAALALSWIALLAALYLPLLAMPRRVLQRGGTLWASGLLTALRVCCGVRHRVVGREHLPHGPAIIAAKHQSAWDTLIFHLLLDDPVYVLKRELLTVPVLGWYFRAVGSIAVDRLAGFRALKDLLPAVEDALSRGSQVIIFPEGTRVDPGERRTYRPGVAALYVRTRVPVVPVALNSGLFWRRGEFRKRPGLITLEVLPQMPTDLDGRAFLLELERRIEGATARLVTEAGRTDAAGADAQTGAPARASVSRPMR